MQIKSGYSLETTIATIRSFYEFLINNLPRQDPSSPPSSSSAHILLPPSSGWPSITSTTLSPLNKSPTVIELLRHLPYLSSDGVGNDVIGPERTRPINYNTEGPDSGVRWSFDRGIIDGILVPFGAGEIPAHVAVLTEGNSYGSWLLLDTETGTVTDFIQQERPERSTPSQESPDHWRAYRTRPIEQFFREWKEKYLSLEWVVVPENPDDGVMYWQNDRWTDEVRAIYRAHGWPDAFRREECRQALLQWQRKPRSD